MNILLVYENVPESTDFYLLCDIAPGSMALRLPEIHNKHGGGDYFTESEQEVLDWIASALCDNPEYANNDGKPGALCHTKRTDDGPIELSGDWTVVRTGWFI